MPTWSKYIVLDLGAESGRVFLVSTDGKRVKIREYLRYQNKPVLINNHLYWNYPKIFDEIKSGIRKAWNEVSSHKETSSPGKAISSLGIDTWGTDFGFISRKGEIISLPFAYRDHKNEGMIEEVRKHLPDDELYRLSGIQIMKVNTLYQLLAIVKSGSPLLKSAHRLLFMPDLFNFLFCGRQVTEYTIASTSQLLDPVKKSWQKEIFEKLCLPYRIMPEIVETGTTLGQMLPEQAKEIGIPRIPVRATASHDTAGCS